MSELERIAISKAREAVDLDRRGSKSEAISKYREVVHILWRLYALAENPVIKSVYREKIQRYLERLSELGDDEGYRSARDLDASPVERAVVAERPRVSWSDVIGLEEAKQAIKESIIYPSLRPDLFPLGWPTGILLFGPPGCGKTLLVAAASNEIDATLYSLDVAQVMSKWLGESEKNIAAVFNRARKQVSEGRPVIIFIDEVDSLAAFRYIEVGGEARARNQLLKEMDGLSSKSKREYIYVIGATNKPWLLDEPFIRRFHRRIYVRHPDKADRVRLFEHYTKRLRLSSDVDLEVLAEATEGYSPADIHSICLDAHMITIREMFEKGLDEPRSILMSDFQQIIARRRPSIIKENVERFEAWRERYGTS